MATALLDSGIIYADRNRNDSFHEPGHRIMQAAHRGDLPQLRILSHNLIEATNAIQKNLGWERAVETYRYLHHSSQFDLVHPSEDDFVNAQSIFVRERELELADALATAYMNRVGLAHIYSFDNDFDRFDQLARLNTDVNPFTD